MSITHMRTSFAHILKPILIVIALVFFVSVFFSYGSLLTNKRQQSEQGGQVLATVNGMPITKAEFDSVLQRQYEMAKGRGGMSALQLAQLKSQLFQQFINERIRISAAQQEKVDVGRREINQERKKIMDEQIEQIRQSAAQGRKRKLSDKELDLLLSRQNPPQSIKSLRSQMKKELTKDVVRQQIMVRKLEDRLKAKAGKIDDQRLTDSFRLLQVRHIVIRVGPNTPDAQAKRKADEILKKIQSGEDFAKLAGQHSDDTYSKSKGGELGLIPPMYDKDLQGLKVGQVSGVIKSDQGYRIVKVEDSKLQLPPDFAKKKKEYRDQLKMTLENQEVGGFYEKLRKTAKIEVREPELKGYWLYDQARAAATPAERNKMLTQAASSLLKAGRENPDLAAPYCILGQIYAQQGNIDKAIDVYSDILDGRKITEGADLRLILAQMYIQKGEKAKAKPQLDLASEMAYDDPNAHYQLQSMYKMVDQPELAAKEEQWIKDYSARMQALQAPPTPKSAGKPAPKPGG